MKKIISNRIESVKYLIEQYILSLIWKYLTKRHDILVNHHPNMACYVFDRNSLYISLHGRTELNQLKVLEERILKTKNFRDSSCLDIGAAIGNHSIFFSKYFKNTFSFEPNQDTYSLLNFNVKNNSKNKVKTFNFGASNKDEEKNLLSIQKTNLGGDRIINDITYMENTRKVSLKKLDKIINQQSINKIELIKLDIEGYELNALKGLEETINKFSPIIIFECHIKDTYLENNKRKSKVIEFLKKKSYKFFYDPSPEYINKKFWVRGIGFINYIIYFISTLIFGLSKRVYKLKRIYNLENKKYFMIICSKEKIKEEPYDNKSNIFFK